MSFLSSLLKTALTLHISIPSTYKREDRGRGCEMVVATSSTFFNL